MKIYQVDAFTDKPFKGNPAAVCILESEPPVKWMQDVANEMNLAETAFLVPKDNGYKLRWFTPESEIDLCGHATLASAHILWEKGYLGKEEEAVFDTKSGMLTARYNEGWIELNFPATPEEKADVPPELIEALAVNPVYTGKSVFDYIIEVESEEVVKSIKPDFTKLMRVQMRGVIVTAQSSRYDFISRFFAPEVGILKIRDRLRALLFRSVLEEKLGKDKFIAYQASKRRHAEGAGIR